MPGDLTPRLNRLGHFTLSRSPTRARTSLKGHYVNLYEQQRLTRENTNSQSPLSYSCLLVSFTCNEPLFEWRLSKPLSINSLHAYLSILLSIHLNSYLSLHVNIHIFHSQLLSQIHARFSVYFNFVSFIRPTICTIHCHFAILTSLVMIHCHATYSSSHNCRLPSLQISCKVSLAVRQESQLSNIFFAYRPIPLCLYWHHRVMKCTKEIHTTENAITSTM